jgi:hypothetical protein
MGGTSPTGGAGGTGGGDEVTDPTIIDNFGSCDTDIARVAGRDGYWYFYADNGVNLSSGVGSPPSGFNDQSCGAWATGGCMTTVDFCTFGGLGFSPLSSESPYSFGGTMGLTFDYEGDQVWIQVYTSGANVFGGTVEASPGGRNPRSFSWGSLSQVQGTAGFLDPSQVVKIEFSAADATAGWGMAVWNVRVF